MVFPFYAGIFKFRTAWFSLYQKQQGLVSVSSKQIKELWPDDTLVTWLQKGRIILGSIEKFLYYKDQTESWRKARRRDLI